METEHPTKAPEPGPIVDTAEAFAYHTLVERQKTHGDFAKNAEISQQIKEIFVRNIEFMHPIHREALDMIACKLARILSGNADYADHWRDISGYASLAQRICSK